MPGPLPRIGVGRRLLVVSPDVPHPTEGASSVLFFYYIDALKQAGFEILNLLLLRTDSVSEERLAEYIDRIAVPGRLEVIPCWSQKFTRFTWTGIQFDGMALEGARTHIEAFRPEVVFCLDLTSAWAVHRLAARPKIVWLGDLNFQTTWYHALYSWKEGAGSLANLLLAQVFRLSWKRVYRRILRQFDRVIVSSKSSEAALARLRIKAKYMPYPWPSLAAERRDTKVKSDKPTFLFFGTLEALGCRSAFHQIIHEIYPRLRVELGPDGFRITICGRGTLPCWASKAITDRSELEFLGFVDDLDEVMAASHALLAPIDVPVGNRSRILSAMANRLMVIAHRNTALGNPDLVDGKTCYLAASSEEFVDRMKRVVERPQEAAEITERAFDAYARNFSPEKATLRMLREIEALVT